MRATPARSPDPRTEREREPDIEVQGIGDLLSTYARCCKPVPPEPIVGYITVGRGVSIHSQSCANLARLSLKAPARVLAVAWGKGEREVSGGHRGAGLRSPRAGARRERRACRRENQHSRHDHGHRQARQRRAHANQDLDHRPAAAIARCWRGSRSCRMSSAPGARNSRQRFSPSIAFLSAAKAASCIASDRVGCA